MLGKLLKIASYPVVESGTNGQQQVTLAHRKVGVGGAVHAQHAHREGALLVKGPFPHQGGGNRNLEILGQPGNLAMGSRNNCTATDVEQRFVGFAEQCDRIGNLSRIAPRRGFVPWNGHRARQHRHIVKLF